MVRGEKGRKGRRTEVTSFPYSPTIYSIHTQRTKRESEREKTHDTLLTALDQPPKLEAHHNPNRTPLKIAQRRFLTHNLPIDRPNLPIQPVQQLRLHLQVFILRPHLAQLLFRIVCFAGDGAPATLEVFEAFFACADGFEVVSDEGVCVRGVV